MAGLRASRQVSFLELATLNQRVRCVVPGWARRNHAQRVGEVMKVYTAGEVAAELKVSYKTVLSLLKRGLLKALPGIRHKRVTEAELNRYLGCKATPGGGS